MISPLIKCYLSNAVELSASRSDGVSEQRLAEDATSGLTRKEVQIASIFLPKNLFCKETRGNACMKWLPVLYYEGSSRNGLYSPLGIETTSQDGEQPPMVRVGMASTARWGLKHNHPDLIDEVRKVGMASTAR